MEKQPYYSISFSGGKDSTALVLEWLSRHICNHIKYPLDEVLYCDTWKEFPAMVRHVAKIEKLVVSAGVKFTRLQSDKSFDYYLFEHQFKKRTQKQIYKDAELVGYGWAGSRSRWCTSKLKQDVINKYFRELEKQYNVIHLIGIAADEMYRLDRPGNKKENHIHPLVNWGWTEAQCLEYCYKRGYDWEGLYTIFSRVSCWCCPLQSLDDLRSLRKYFPELWQELREMDRKTWRVFKHDYTVEDLEKRFTLEDQYIAEGKSIKSREFYAVLKYVVPPRLQNWVYLKENLQRRLTPKWKIKIGQVTAVQLTLFSVREITRRMSAKQTTTTQQSRRQLNSSWRLSAFHH